MKIIEFIKAVILPKRKMKTRKVIRLSYRGKIVAKYLYGIDIDGYMYEDIKNRPDCCPICHNTLRKIPNLEKKFYVKNLDIGWTYDHYCVVSERFKDFCEKEGYPNLLFIPLKSKGMYYFEAQDIYKLDYKRYGTRFIDKRDCCGSYDEVIGPPVSTQIGFDTGSDDFIMRSEYMFASYYYKSYSIIVGPKTALKMKEYGLKRIYFDNIYDSNVKVLEKEMEITSYNIAYDAESVQRTINAYKQETDE